MSMTSNQQSVIDEGEFTVRRTIRINAPLEKVWAAITEAEHLAKWFPETAVLEPAAVGATGAFTWADHGTFPVVIDQLDPLRSISYRWNNESGVPVDSARSTVFTFTLESVDAATQLTVVETGFDSLSDPSAAMESNRGGWDFELDELVAYLEGSS